MKKQKLFEEISRMKILAGLINKSSESDLLQTERSWNMPDDVSDNDPYFNIDDSGLSDFDNHKPHIKISEYIESNIDDLPNWKYEISGRGFGIVCADKILQNLGIEFWETDYFFKGEEENFEIKSIEDNRKTIYELLKKSGKSIESVIRELVSNSIIGPFTNDDDWKEDEPDFYNPYD